MSGAVPSYAAIEARARARQETREQERFAARRQANAPEVPAWVAARTHVGGCEHWRSGRTRYHCEYCNPPKPLPRFSQTSAPARGANDPPHVDLAPRRVERWDSETGEAEVVWRERGELGPLAGAPRAQVAPGRAGAWLAGSPAPDAVSPLRRRLWRLARGLRQVIADPAGRPVARCACGARYDGAGFLGLAAHPNPPEGTETRFCATCARTLQVSAAQVRGPYPLSRPRIGACRFARTGQGNVALRFDAAEDRPYFAGLQHCGSVWECPTCAARICAGRAEQLETLLDRHGRERALFVTLTVRHGVGEDLPRLFRQLADAYRGMIRGAPWARFAERWGIVGMVRSLETTHGYANGWHPHLHLVWLTRAPLDRRNVLRFRDADGRTRMRYAPGFEGADDGPGGELPELSASLGSPDVRFLFERWRECVARYLDPVARCPHCETDFAAAELDALSCAHCKGAPGICTAQRCNNKCPDDGHCNACERRCRCGKDFVPERCPSPRRGANLPDVDHGIDVVPLTDARYLAKLGLELNELTGKKARGANRSPWQIASDLTDRPTRADAGLWRDYTAAVRGRRKLTFSRGLLRRYMIDDAEDETLAGDEPADMPGLTVCELSPETWDFARRATTETGDALPAVLLDAACQGGAPAVSATLARYRAPP